MYLPHSTEHVFSQPVLSWIVVKLSLPCSGGYSYFNFAGRLIQERENMHVGVFYGWGLQGATLFPSVRWEMEEGRLVAGEAG